MTGEVLEPRGVVGEEDGEARGGESGGQQGRQAEAAQGAPPERAGKPARLPRHVAQSREPGSHHERPRTQRRQVAVPRPCEGHVEGGMVHESQRRREAYEEPEQSEACPREGEAGVRPRWGKRRLPLHGRRGGEQRGPAVRPEAKGDGQDEAPGGQRRPAREVGGGDRPRVEAQGGGSGHEGQEEVRPGGPGRQEDPFREGEVVDGRIGEPGEDEPLEERHADQDRLQQGETPGEPPGQGIPPPEVEEQEEHGQHHRRRLAEHPRRAQQDRPRDHRPRRGMGGRGRVTAHVFRERWAARGASRNTGSMAGSTAGVVSRATSRRIAGLGALRGKRGAGHGRNGIGTGGRGRKRNGRERPEPGPGRQQDEGCGEEVLAAHDEADGLHGPGMHRPDQGHEEGAGDPQPGEEPPCQQGVAEVDQQVRAVEAGRQERPPEPAFEPERGVEHGEPVHLDLGNGRLMGRRRAGLEPDRLQALRAGQAGVRLDELVVVPREPAVEQGGGVGRENGGEQEEAEPRASAEPGHLRSLRGQPARGRVSSPVAVRCAGSRPAIRRRRTQGRFPAWRWRRPEAWATGGRSVRALD